MHLRLGQPLQRPRGRRRRDHGLDVGRVTRSGAADVRVLTRLGDGEELLGRRTAHRAGRRRDDDVLQAEPVEDLDVRVPVQLVRPRQALVVQVEGVRVLHDELAPAQDPGAGPRLVPVLGLDLVQHDRVVLVRAVLTLHSEREQLLVRGSEQVVGALAVLEPEQAVAVLGPAAGLLVRLARQQRGELDLLRPDRVHLLAHHGLDVAQHAQAQRQPGVPARGDAADVAGADQQLVAGHFGVGRVLAQGAKEQRRHPGDHWSCSSG